jgi:hypothetical protein
VFVERADDFGMGDVIAEHAINHVADGMGKASDFAVAGFGGGGAAGRRRLDAGFRVLDTGFWILDAGWGFSAAGGSVALNGRKDIACGSGAEFVNDLGWMVCHMAKGVECFATGKESFFWCLWVTMSYYRLLWVTGECPNVEVRNPKQNRNSKGAKK